MPGPTRKPAAERQRRNLYPSIGAPHVPDREPPAPPSGLRPSLVDEWLEFWRSPMAGLVAASDLGALRRLWQLRERSAWATSSAEYSDEPVPLMRLATTIDAEIRQLEDHFGLTPKSRLRFVSELDDAQRAEAAIRDREQTGGTGEGGDDGAPLLADLLDGQDPRPAGGEVDGAGARPRRGRPRG